MILNTLSGGPVFTLSFRGAAGRTLPPVSDVIACDVIVVKSLYITFLIYREQFAFQVYALRIIIKLGFWGILGGCTGCSLVKYAFFVYFVIKRIFDRAPRPVFLKLFYSFAPFLPSTRRFRPPSLIKQTQGSKYKEFYLKHVWNSWTMPLDSWTKQLYYDANITFRILVKIIHTVAGDTDDPG